MLLPAAINDLYRFKLYCFLLKPVQKSRDYNVEKGQKRKIDKTFIPKLCF